MTAQPVPVSRQPGCSACPHEQHVLGCDWCLCQTSPAVGFYPEPWPVSDWDWPD